MILRCTPGVPVMRPIRFVLVLAMGSMLSSLSVTPRPLVAAQNGDGLTVEQRVISPDEASANIGKDCTVELVVASSRLLDDKGACFLNSEKDHRDKGNFTVVIFRAALAKFEAKGIANPADEYLEKKIRVSGRIDDRNGAAQIVVENPTQIVAVLDENSVRGDGQDR